MIEIYEFYAMNKEIRLQLFYFQNAVKLNWSSVCGKNISFIHPGEWNLYDGPDFKNAHFIADGCARIGDVEIHINSSDWLRHGHQNDKRYNNVALHLVSNCDAIIPQCGAHIVAPSNWYDTYLLPCNVRENKLFDLHHKVSRLQNWINRYGQSKAAYILVARALGRHVQGDAMQLLAESVYEPLLELNGSIKQVSILLHGMAGQLSSESIDTDFYLNWRRAFLKSGMGPLNDEILWNKRVSIASRPCLKVAQLIHLHSFVKINSFSDLLSDPLLFKSILANLSASDYWINHYQFGQKMKSPAATRLSLQAQESIFMNTIPIWEFANHQDISHI